MKCFRIVYEYLAEKEFPGIEQQKAEFIKLLNVIFLFSVMACVFLVYFGIHSFLSKKITHGIILLALALSVVLNYICLFRFKKSHIFRYCLVIMMGILCVYLTYTGGINGSGLCGFMFSLC